MHIDIEKLASGYGERAIADGRYTLSKGDYILSLDDLKRYTALANHPEIPESCPTSAGR